jgi:DNA-binding NarL/FixJ family response regulator
MTRKSVLVVDDDPAVRSMVREILELHTSYEVVAEAENGCDAILQAAKVNPDLIILEHFMPTMNGLDAAPLLKKVVPDTRLILFTAHDGAELQRHALAAGIEAVVSKERLSELIPQAQRLLSTANA